MFRFMPNKHISSTENTSTSRHPRYSSHFPNNYNVSLLREGHALLFHTFMKLVMVVFLFAITVQAQGADDHDVLFDFAIKSQKLAKSLNEFSNETEVLILFPYDLVEHKRSSEVKGRYTVDKALELMLVNTGLKGGRTSKGVLTILTSDSTVVSYNLKEKNSSKKKTIWSGLTSSLFGKKSKKTSGQALKDGKLSSSLIEEIVVTAQKRSQSIQDVGISITAFTGSQLDDANLSNAGDVVNATPGAIARRHFPSRGLTTNLFFRGVGQTGFADGDESPIAAFVDEFYLIATSQVDFATYDVERVEVLKGPQGTVFGRNATGGAIQSVTRKPAEEFSGEIKVGAASFGGELVEGYFNVPLSDKSAFRFSGVSDRHDPLLKNLFEGQPDILDQDFRSGRFQFRYQPNDRLNVNLKYEAGRTEGRIVGDQAIIFAGTAEGDILQIEENGAGFNPSSEGVDGGDITSEDSLNFGSNEIDHILARIDYEGENFTFTSISGYLDQGLLIFEDCDGTPNPTCGFSPDVNSKHFTQEFRLSGQQDRFNWIAGLFYLEQEAINDLVLPTFLTRPEGANALPSLEVADIDWKLDVRSLALFGQVEYVISDSLTLVSGARVGSDKKSFEQTLFNHIVNLPAQAIGFSQREFFRPQDFFPGNVTDSDAGQIFTREAVGDLTVQDDTSFGGKLQLDFRPNDSVLFYGSFRRGVKAAGFNNGLTGAINNDNIELFPYEEEILHAFEVGWKYKFQGAVAGRFNGAVYYYDYQDYQATSYIEVGNLISNNDAKVSGGEVELQISPTDGWFIGLGAAFIFDSEVEGITRQGFLAPGNVSDSTSLFTADRELPEAPDLSLNALIRYEWKVISGSWGAQVNGNYTGQRFDSSLNQTSLQLDAYTEINSSLKYKSQNGISIKAWVTNLTDERVATNELAAPTLDFLGQLNFNERRRYGITVGYEF